MTIHRITVYNLSCDHPGCDEWSGDQVPDGDDTAKARTARKWAASDGWTHRNGKDYCPEHGS